MGSLQTHAMPLNERALAGLVHSAMALDLYAWLAQCLHRVPRRQTYFVPWASLEERGRLVRKIHNCPFYKPSALLVCKVHIANAGMRAQAGMPEAIGTWVDRVSGSLCPYKPLTPYPTLSIVKNYLYSKIFLKRF